MFGKRQRPLEKFLSIPDFTTLVEQVPDTPVESNEVTVTADNAWVFTALVRGNNAELNVNGTGWAKDAAFRNGDTIKLRASSSSQFSTEIIIDLYAQSTNKQWRIITILLQLFVPLGSDRLIDANGDTFRVQEV